MNQLVIITWLDAQDHKDTWVDSEAAEKFNDVECKIISVGFLIRKTAKYLTLGSDWDEADKDYGTVRKIPVGMIQEIKEVNVEENLHKRTE
jgi:hypothetical protein